MVRFSLFIVRGMQNPVERIQAGELRGEMNTFHNECVACLGGQVFGVYSLPSELRVPSKRNSFLNASALIRESSLRKARGQLRPGNRIMDLTMILIFITPLLGRTTVDAQFYFPVRI